VIAIILPAITAQVLLVVVGVNAIEQGVFGLTMVFRLRVAACAASGRCSLVLAVLVTPGPALAHSRSAG
jgi:hypothetical protein